MLLGELIGDSPAIREVRDQIGRLLDRPRESSRLPPVLFQGETGTGKGLLARAIHRAGPRRNGPFIDVNCAAIPETLLEAEMFGFERGAFTDARQSKAGLFETADRGTLFLDEVGFLADPLQAKLLKVIEEQTVRRLGATRSRPVDVWIFGATSEDLAKAMRQGRFRPELYHRLAVFTVRLPALRERGDDIVLLAEHFLGRACADYHLPPKSFSHDARAALRGQPWTGNVRELSNVIERAALLVTTPIISARDLALSDVGESPPPRRRRRIDGESTPATTERHHLLEALHEASWNLTAAAARLEIPRNTLRYRMERHGLRPPPPSRRRVTRSGVDVPSRSPANEPGHGNEIDRDRTPLIAEAPIHVGVRWERRRVALLRVDLVIAPGGVTPETDTSRPLAVLAQKLRSFGGRIEEAGLTQVVAAFGLDPVEDAPRRAALAAIAIVKTAERARRTTAPHGAVKLAIDVADCLVGHIDGAATMDVDSKRQSCSRLESLIGHAEPYAVILSEAASTFVERHFDLLPLGHQTPGAGACYVLGGPERLGYDVKDRAGTFRGRQHELSLLESHLASVCGARGQVVAIIGEAGIGKSRIVYEFRQHFHTQQITYLEGRCYSYASDVPYFPVLDIIRQLCGIIDADDADVIETKMRLALERLGIATSESCLYLLHLFGIDRERSLRDVNPELIKVKTFDAVRQTILSASRLQPCVVLVEDLHWIDNASAELLALLVASVPGARLLFVVTYRPEYQPAWLARSYVTQMALAPLSPEDSRAVIESTRARTPLPPEVVDVIVEKADGNPFFLEELTRAIGEYGQTDSSVPDTIHTVLMARIGKLTAEDRRLLQVAAVIGRDVPVAVIEKVADEAPALLRQRLRYLQAAEFLYERAPAPEAEYVFKHALTQEVAYRSLPPHERRPLHAKTAQVLARLSPDVKEHRPESIARHLTAAEQPDEAVPLWLRAGRNAIRRSANAEAVTHLTTALDLLMTTLESRERDRRELELRVTLGPALVMTKGYAAAEVESVYRRARALCQRLGDAPQLFRATRGVWLFYLVRGDLRAAQDTGEQLLAMATKADNAVLLAQAHLALGAPLFYRGEFAEARSNLEQSIALCRANGDAARGPDGPEPSVESFGFLAWTLGMQGCEAESLGCLEAALRRADRHGQAFSLASALNFAGVLRTVYRDFDATREYAEREAAIAREHRFPHLLGTAIWLRGRVLAAEGRPAEGLKLMSEGLAMLMASGGLAATYYLSHIADTHLIAGDIEQGLAVITEAFVAAERNDENFYLPELHRLRAELLAANLVTSHEAESHFTQAIALARRQGSAVLGRRAEESFAAYLRARGRASEADRATQPATFGR